MFRIKKTTLLLFQRLTLIGSFLVISVFATSCSLKRSSPDSVNPQIQVKIKSEEKLITPFESFFYFLSTPPTTVGGFQCLVINVVGSGIPPQSNFDQSGNYSSPDSLIPGLLSGNYCTYPGILSAPFSSSGSATRTLNVPAGANRIVQVLGISDPNNTFCPTGQFTSNDTSEPYELGRAIVDLFQNTSVNITTHYNSLSANDKLLRSVDCDSSSGTTYDPNSDPDLTLWYEAGFLTDSSNTAVTVPANQNLPTSNIGWENLSDNITDVSNLSWLSYIFDGTNNAANGSATDYDYLYLGSNAGGLTPTGTHFETNALAATLNEDIFDDMSTNGFTLFYVGLQDLSSVTSQDQAIGTVGFTSNTNFEPDSTKTFLYLDNYVNGANTNFRARFCNACSTVPTDIVVTSGFTDYSGTENLIHVLRYNGTTVEYKIYGAGEFHQNSSAVSITWPTTSTTSKIHLGQIQYSSSCGTACTSHLKGASSTVLYYRTYLDNTELDEVVQYLKAEYNVN